MKESIVIKLHDWTMRCFEKSANAGYWPACELYGHILIHKGVNPEAKMAGARYLEAIPIDRLSMQASYQLYQVFREGSFGMALDTEKAERYRQRAKALEHPLLS
jgi:hypothetical protein